VRSETIRRVEFVAAVALSILAVALLIVHATHAGGLWRDECDTVATATLPFPDLLRYFQFDALPLSFLIALRGYVAIAGNNDASLRLLGVLIGIGLLAIAWWSARRLRIDAPLVFIALVILNPAFLIWGTTVRGYGLACVTIVFAFAATGKFLTHGTTRDAVLMGIAFVAAVQCLVSNTVLVFAISAGAIGVSLYRRQLKAAAMIAGALGAAALSFLPYLATYSKTGWHVVLQTTVTLSALSSAFLDSLGGNKLALAWVVLIVVAAIVCASHLAKKNSSPLPAYALLVALFSVAGLCVFLKVLRYIPQQWYFLPLISLLAVALDLTLMSNATSTAVRAIKFCVCVVAVAITCSLSWPALTARQSNIDLAAHWLGAHARNNDLVVVNPWFVGVSFDRYYRGAAPWITVPMMNERRIHRYDLLQEKMTEDDPVKDIRSTIESTLRGDGRVYLVGGVHLLEKNEQPLVLPPAPKSKYGWSLLPYIVVWSQQIGGLLQAHAQTVAEVPPFSDNVNPEENVPLWQAEGWRD
jgi:hypothetical protein